MIVELNRRLVKGYTTYKDDPRIVSLKKSVLAYNKELMMLNVRDHQISYARFSIHKVVFTLFYRLAKLAVLSTAVLPGLVLFAPVFVAGKVISIKKSREALAASTVKIQGRDVMATWKLLVSMALCPVLYTWYTAILTYWHHYNSINGLLPENLPTWTIIAFGYIFFPAITFMALRFGETGMDIAKSLRPLILSLGPTSHNTMFRLREKRNQLVEQVTEVINELGPELYPDFDHQRIVTDPSHPLSPGASRPQTPKPGGSRSASYSWNSQLSMSSPSDTSPPQNRLSATPGAGIGGGSGAGSSHLPRNESFANLGGIGIFATRPGTPNRSRSRARSDSGDNGAPLKRVGSGNGVMLGGLSMTSSSKPDSMDEVSKKIRGAMRERGRRRRSEDLEAEADEAGWDMADAAGDESEEEDDEEKKTI